MFEAVYIPTSRIWGYPLHHILFPAQSFILAILVGEWWCILVTFDFISLLTGDVEHLSTYTLDIWASSSLKWLFETLDHLNFWFCPSKTWFVVLFYHRGLGVLRYMYCKYRLSLHNWPLVSWWCLLMDTKFVILKRNVSISFFFYD